jgi:hypothetical protein
MRARFAFSWDGVRGRFREGAEELSGLTEADDMAMWLPVPADEHQPRHGAMELLRRKLKRAKMSVVGRGPLKTRRMTAEYMPIAKFRVRMRRNWELGDGGSNMSAG